MEEQEVIDRLMRTERIASVVGQLPGFMRNELANIVDGEQIPGSFGDLVKNSFGLIEEGEQLEDGNVVSMVGRRATIKEL